MKKIFGDFIFPFPTLLLFLTINREHGLPALFSARKALVKGYNIWAEEWLSWPDPLYRHCPKN